VRPGLGPSVGIATLGGPRRRDGVEGVRLASAPPALAVGPVHLDDRDPLAVQVPGESGPVTAGPFDTDQLEGPEGLQPGQ
jgi:hypothetical protein